MRRRIGWLVVMTLMAGCIGKKGERSVFEIYGVEWVGEKVGVLGLYTRYEVFGGGLIGERLKPKYSRDVMFFVDPSTVYHDPQSGWWLVKADSVWIIHTIPRIIHGHDLRKDPKGRGWWVAGYLFDESSPYGQPKIMLYDSTFSQILLSLDGGGISFFPSGDSILFGRDDTIRIYDLIRQQEIPLFRRSGLMEVSPNGKIYIAGSDRRLVRWEGGDSFTVIIGTTNNFGFKGDTLVIQGGRYFHFLLDTTYVKRVPHNGQTTAGLWKWKNNKALATGSESKYPLVCIPNQTGEYLCGYIHDYYLACKPKQTGEYLCE